MLPPDNARVTLSGSIEIQASPEDVYEAVADLRGMGRWSPENVGGRWVDDGTGKVGDWFEGDNVSGEREWTRAVEVAVADRGRDFTFVVGGVDANCTSWSYEMEAIDGGTRLTERWWVVNLTEAMQAATQEQFDQRVAFTQTSIEATLAAIKVSLES